MMNIYKEELLDHYRYPRNRGTLSHPDFCSEQLNPSCGDSVQFAGTVTNNTITSLAFQGTGCVISQATASMLSEKVLNVSIDAIITFDTKFVIDVIGFELGPTRLKCALLPLAALQEGVKKYKAKKNKA